MALIVLHDPYEWFDPEEGRQGVLIHSGQIRGREHMVRPQLTWQDVWRKIDAETIPFVVDGGYYGPDHHPYGPEAYQITIYGTSLIFPNKEGADKWLKGASQE